MILICECIVLNWLSELNPIEIGLGFLLGIVGSIIFAITSEKIKSENITSQHKKIIGSYIRYWEDKAIVPEDTLFSKAILKQVKENYFEIEVHTFLEYGTNNLSAGKKYTTENIEIWTGAITMDSLRNGTVVWEQRNPSNGNNGFKRIILEKDFSGITLVGEKDGGFGIEKFTEKINVS